MRLIVFLFLFVSFFPGVCFSVPDGPQVVYRYAQSTLFGEPPPESDSALGVCQLIRNAYVNYWASSTTHTYSPGSIDESNLPNKCYFTFTATHNSSGSVSDSYVSANLVQDVYCTYGNDVASPVLAEPSFELSRWNNSSLTAADAPFCVQGCEVVYNDLFIGLDGTQNYRVWIYSAESGTSSNCSFDSYGGLEFCTGPVIVESVSGSGFVYTGNKCTSTANNNYSASPASPDSSFVLRSGDTVTSGFVSGGDTGSTDGSSSVNVDVDLAPVVSAVEGVGSQLSSDISASESAIVSAVGLSGSGVSDSIDQASTDLLSSLSNLSGAVSDSGSDVVGAVQSAQASIASNGAAMVSALGDLSSDIGSVGTSVVSAVDTVGSKIDALSDVVSNSQPASVDLNDLCVNSPDYDLCMRTVTEFSGCSSPPVCSGNQGMCTAIRELWESRCAADPLLQDLITDLSQPLPVSSTPGVESDIVSDIDASVFYDGFFDQLVPDPSVECPPDVQFDLLGVGYALSYGPFCQFADYIKPVVLLVSGWLSFLVVFRSLSRM